MATSFTQGTLSLIILQAISIHLPCITRRFFRALLPSWLLIQSFYRVKLLLSPVV